jgi:hypothetical protein
MFDVGVQTNQILAGFQNHGNLFQRGVACPFAKKYLITFIQDGYNAADDASAYTSEMEEKLKNLTQWQADKIQNARKTSTQTQEQVILDLLREHL